MLLVRRGDEFKLRALRHWPAAGKASAIVFPLRWSDDPLGALLLTYAVPRSFGGDFLPAAKLLGGFVEMEMANQELGRRLHQQGEWISRLTSDVERMGNLLRGLEETRTSLSD